MSDSSCNLHLSRCKIVPSCFGKIYEYMMVNGLCIWIHRTVRCQWFVISEMVSDLVAIGVFEFVMWVVPLAELSDSLSSGRECFLGLGLVLLLICG